jgi:hypothetical protein
LIVQQLEFTTTKAVDSDVEKDITDTVRVRQQVQF